MEELCQQQPEEYRQDWCHISSGRDVSNKKFEMCYMAKLTELRNMYNLRLDCIGCCWLYLVRKRGYSPTIASRFDGCSNRVQFILPDSPRALTLMYLDCPVSNGAVQVAKQNLGVSGYRPVQAGCSYQFYMNERKEVGPTQLSMVTTLPVRLESLAVDKMQDPRNCADQLRQCYFRYYDAALFELWRESRGLDSLRGKILYAPQSCHSHGDLSHLTAAVKKEPNDERGVLTLTKGTVPDPAEMVPY